MSRPHQLSDGTTVRIRTRRTIVGTVYEEVPSRKRRGATLMRIDNRMYLVAANQLVPVTNPAYACASTDKDGAHLALTFCIESAEAVIAHAREEGIPVEDCYAPPTRSWTPIPPR